MDSQTVPLAKGADVACIFVNGICDKTVINHLADDGVKLIALRCTGFNNVDVEAAKGKGIRVVRVPAYSPHGVAEYAVTLMLCLNRKIYRAVNRTREGNFSLEGLMGFNMYQKTIGIIGMGRIAREVVKILHGFGMRIIVYEPHPKKEIAEQYNIEYVTLPELYAQSDIISLHCPLTPSTKYLINHDSINQMKKGVMIINTGRGQLIHTDDLIEGLKEKKIGNAGLDVYEEEGKYFYEDHSDYMIDDDTLVRLLMIPNVIVTSHQAFFTKEALHNIATTLENIHEFVEGKELTNEVK